MRTRAVWVATQYSKKGTIHFNVQPSKSGRTMRRGTFRDRSGHTANRLRICLTLSRAPQKTAVVKVLFLPLQIRPLSNAD
ncbi:hypothetical protein [Alloprevotella tannerae]|jgi:hypothetical protein|uniref:hypothetical protein n=1 Tax=Alloprevotella tannerae TaxID=76122 RepID=UPI0028E75D0F|nr:hypothetical protein [Alloprevotella tannerae]